MPEPLVPCQVWLADIDWLRHEHVDLLDRAESARLEKYWRPDDRARFVTAAVLLRLVVAAELRIPVRDVVVDRSCERCGQPHGKPRIPGSDLHVSLSHSGRVAALALTRAGPVGIDVEAKTRGDVDTVAATVLAPGEVRRGPDDFYVYWCRKEAVVKATGAGLRVPFIDVVVSDAGQPAQLLGYPGPSIDCTMQDLEVEAGAGPGYAGAIAVLAAGNLTIERQDARAVLDREPLDKSHN